LEECKTSGLVTKVHVKEVFLVTKSAYQTINVVDLDVFGRSLILDGVMQSAECDERIYHESLVHPALCAHPNPKTVFIAGGGEGATAREILRFKSVEKCVMVDIDDVVIESSKAYLQQHHNGAFQDPRLHLVVGDAEGWIRSANEKFDVIVMDLPDPQEGGPCWRMYTKEFYQILSDLLNPGGLLVSQCGPSSPHFAPKVFSPVHNTLSTVFKYVAPYSSFLPSSMEPYGFTMVSNYIDFSTITKELVDKRVAENVQGENEYYDGTTHFHMFSVPKNIRKLLAAETRVGTLSDPQCFLKLNSEQ